MRTSHVAPPECEQPGNCSPWLSSDCTKWLRTHAYAHEPFHLSRKRCHVYSPSASVPDMPITEHWGFKNIQVSKSHSSIARNAFQLTFQIFICKWAPKAYCCVFWRIQNILKRFLFTLLMGTFFILIKLVKSKLMRFYSQPKIYPVVRMISDSSITFL